MEKSDSAFHSLRLFHGQGDLMLGSSVAVADDKLRGSRAVNPFVEELLPVNVIRFFDGLDEIRGDDVFAAMDFEIVPQAAIESILANLVAEHVQHQSALSVSVVVKLAGVVKIVPHDRLAVQVGLAEPLLDRAPSLVVSLLFGIVRFGPHHLEERCEALIQPDVSPVVAGNQVAEPLMRQLVRNQWFGDLRSEEHTSELQS